MGRRSLTEQRRVEICRALQDCMLESGSYDGTSIRDIGKRIGLTHSIMLHYFGSKDEILLMETELVLVERNNRLYELFKAESDSRRQIVSDLVNDARTNRFLLMVSNLSSSIPELASLISDLRKECISTVVGLLSISDGSERVEEMLFVIDSALGYSSISNPTFAMDLICREFDRLISSN